MSSIFQSYLLISNYSRYRLTLSKLNAHVKSQCSPVRSTGIVCRKPSKLYISPIEFKLARLNIKLKSFYIESYHVRINKSSRSCFRAWEENTKIKSLIVWLTHLKLTRLVWRLNNVFAITSANLQISILSHVTTFLTLAESNNCRQVSRWLCQRWSLMNTKSCRNSCPKN